jgi:3-oxoacyl-[acyl-carrier-protein] synthase-1
MRIYITGLGAVSAIGMSVAEHLDSLLHARHGISQIELVRELKTTYLGGEIKLTNDQLKAKLGLDPLAVYSRTALLAMLAAKEAYPTNFPNRLRVGVLNGTSVGGMDLSENFYEEYLKGDKSNKEVILAHECGTSTQNVADLLEIKGYRTTLSTACSSAANAIMLAARMMQAGQLDAALAGGTDALSAFTINGFNSLGIYDNELSRPFDETRKGLNMGEGAGFVFLETEESVEKSGNPILVELIGWGNANDAFHQTASSPEATGAKLSMSTAMKIAQVAPQDIDYINAHGTGTENNDNTEAKAIGDLFPGKKPPFSSTKQFTGHTLAAAGGLEAVFSVLSIKQGIIYPNLRWKNQMSMTELTPALELERKEINCVLSNSFGFGGNNSTLIFRKV